MTVQTTTVRVTLYRHSDEEWLGVYDTQYPPAVGDVVWLSSGAWAVTRRAWTYPSKGSPAEQQGDGPLLDVMLDPALGLFR